MNRGNEIIVKLQKGAVARVGSLFQYDYGQRLVIQDVELPESYEVHFANSDDENSITMIGDSTGVDIPDALLLTGKDINGWIYLHNGEDDGETEYCFAICVLKRAKPTNQDPTPVQQDEITQVMAALNNAVSTVEGMIAEIPVLDDTAGEGDTDKVWSADRIIEYVASVITPAEGVDF